MKDKRELECHLLTLAALLFFNPQQAASVFDTPDLDPRKLKSKKELFLLILSYRHVRHLTQLAGFF
jgi:hypothetical protein